MTGIMQMLIGAIKASLPQFLYTWGNDSGGKLGHDTITVNKSSPTQVGSLEWLKVSMHGNFHSLAIRNDNRLYAWGYNTNGKLGNNSVVDKSSPVVIGSRAWAECDGAMYGSSFAIRTNGTLWAWGSDTSGLLAQNTRNYSKSSPVQVGSLTTWSKVFAGNTHCLALRTDGTLWGWGNNTWGKIGDGGRTARSSPVQVFGAATWISAGANEDYSFGVKTDGTLWFWGNGNFGRSGNNTAGLNRSRPTQIGALSDWAQVSVGRTQTNAVKTDGTLWAWGINDNGQCGIISPTARISSPTQVGALTTWIKCSQGNNVGAAIKSDGSLWAWGGGNYTNNNVGQAGQNNIVQYSSPVQVGSGSWKEVSAKGGLWPAVGAIEGTPE